MGSARFIRHYSGHHGCFLFLRLLICLNLAGHLACSQVEQQTTNNMTAAEGRRGCLRPTRSAFREGPIAGCGQGRLRSVRDPRSRPSGARPLGRSPGGRSLHTTRGHAVGRAAARAQCREGRASRRPTRRSDTDPEPDMDGGRASVRNVRSKCRCSHVLQFTFRRAVCCVLHRPPSQVIHCTVLFSHHSLSLSLSCNCRALTGREPLALGAATATAHDDNTGSVASAVRTSRRPFLGRPWRARRGPGRGRATWGSRGRLGGPRTKDPEVRASADNRLVLPRPVPAAVRVRVGATPLRQTGRTVAPGVGEDSCSAARRDPRRRLQRRRRRRPRGARLAWSLMILLQVHLQ
jgi:hypothetical protein